MNEVFNDVRRHSLALLLIACALFILTACGGGTASAPPLQPTAHAVSFAVDGAATITASANEGTALTAPARPVKGTSYFVG